jgi:hypothetical protein
MTNRLEFSARAALCRQLAGREPDSKDLWLAEAERWSHLTPEPAAAVATPAETWCCKFIQKRRPLDVNMAELQFYLRKAEKAAGREAFEVLNGLSLEAGDAN